MRMGMRSVSTRYPYGLAREGTLTRPAARFAQPGSPKPMGGMGENPVIPALPSESGT